MRKKEIDIKFDEIIDFSGCALYVDTPIKRFSSGMKVRLGFAVAAFLEPEILIVDEVLAVGDAEFQKKAIGKMQDISSGGGRTVLFVSHNMAAVKSLCTKALVLKNGGVEYTGGLNKAFDIYQQVNIDRGLKQNYTNNIDDAPGNEYIRLEKVELKCANDNNIFFTVESDLTLEFEFSCLENFDLLHNTVSVLNLSDEVIFSVVNKPTKAEKGRYKSVCEINGNLLNYGKYKVNIFFVKDELTPVFIYENAVVFDIEDKKREINYFGPWKGYVRPKLNFSIQKIN
jgi:lipopolysaccharide transport system ATP-binding protein